MNVHKNLTAQNFTSSIGRGIKYIVVHYTAGKNDTARANTEYFKKAYRGASAHYFIDEGGVWQCVEDKDIAWHVGAVSYKHRLCRNYNSIGVEMCTSYTPQTGYYIDGKTAANTACFVRELMEKYSIPIENVLRHYDVTGKCCPAPWVTDGNKWEMFKETVEEKIDMEELKRLQEQVQSLVDTVDALTAQLPAVYHYTQDVPDWGRATVQKLLDKGIFCGAAKDDLNLPEGMLRIFVVNDRAGLYD